MGCHTSQRHPVGTHRGRNLSTEAVDARAAEAEHTVTSLFGHRLLGLPGTHLARVAFPAPPRGGPWHYWWQAHYLDATIDAPFAWASAEAAIETLIAGGEPAALAL